MECGGSGLSKSVSDPTGLVSYRKQNVSPLTALKRCSSLLTALDGKVNSIREFVDEKMSGADRNNSGCKQNRVYTWR